MLDRTSTLCRVVDPFSFAGRRRVGRVVGRRDEWSNSPSFDFLITMTPAKRSFIMSEVSSRVLEEVSSGFTVCRRVSRFVTEEVSSWVLCCYRRNNYEIAINLVRTAHHETCSPTPPSQNYAAHLKPRAAGPPPQRQQSHRLSPSRRVDGGGTERPQEG